MLYKRTSSSYIDGNILAIILILGEWRPLSWLIQPRWKSRRRRRINVEMILTFLYLFILCSLYISFSVIFWYSSTSSSSSRVIYWHFLPVRSAIRFIVFLRLFSHGHLQISISYVSYTKENSQSPNDSTNRKTRWQLARRFLTN